MDMNGVPNGAIDEPRPKRKRRAKSPAVAIKAPAPKKARAPKKAKVVAVEPIAQPAPAIVIETAGCDEDAFCDVFELLLALHKEGGFARLDGEKAGRAVYQTLKEGMTFVARVEGKAIGVLALTELPFWYSAATHLLDVGFYVAPKWRKGAVGKALLEAARVEAQVRNKILLITVTNPDRRPKGTRTTIESQIAGFVPVGYTLQL